MKWQLPASLIWKRISNQILHPRLPPVILERRRAIGAGQGVAVEEGFQAGEDIRCNERQVEGFGFGDGEPGERQQFFDADFMRRVDQRPEGPMAAAFRYSLDDIGAAPRVLEAFVRLRCLLLAMPYGDQGLLIANHFYRQIGGYAQLPIMEDLDIVRRLGRRRITMLRSCALTSAKRYRDDGYINRILRNQACLALYFAGVPIVQIQRFYQLRASVTKSSSKIKSA